MRILEGPEHHAAVIRGEPGVGKTALLGALADLSESQVLRISGVESEAHLPFGALAELLLPLRGHLDSLPDAQREALETSLALRPGPGAGMLATCAGALGALTAAAERHPLLVIVDDLHWVDPSSAQVLKFVCRRLLAEPIGMVLALRVAPTSISVPPELPEMVLEGLPVDDGVRLVQAIDAATSSTAADHIARSTGGNPLAIIETVQGASEIDLRGTGTGVRARAGRSLDAAWTKLLDELSHASRTVVIVAAAAGPSELQELLPVLGALGVAVEAVEPAERAGLIVVDRSGQVVLRHPLLRPVVMDHATSTLRLRVHRALAEHTAGARRAWFLAASSDGPDDTVADLLAHEARAAAARGGHGSAAQAWLRSAELCVDPAVRAERLLAAAGSFLQSGALDRALSISEQALANRADLPFVADVTRVRSRALAWSGRVRRASDDLVDMARRIRDHDGTRADALLAEAVPAVAMTGRVEEATDLVRELQEARNGGPSAGSVPRPWAVEAHVPALAGRIAEARAVLDTIVLAGPSLDSVWGLHDAAYAAHASIFVERLDEAQQLLDRVVDVARRDGVAAVLTTALAMRAEVETWTGRWAAASADAIEAVRWADEFGERATLGLALVTLARLDAGRGDVAEAEQRLARVAHDVGTSGIDCLHAYVPAVRGLLALGTGRPSAAVEHLEEAHRCGLRFGLGSAHVVPYGADLVEALVRSGGVERARAVLDWWDERADETGLAFPRATAARCHGLLADDPEAAAAWFARAHEAHDRLDIPFERARTLLCEAETLRRFRRPGAARSLLREASTLFSALRAHPWLERATAELSAAGGTGSPSTETTDVLGLLTPQEFQVARAVAEGRNNAETAAALYVSHKTVEAHLTRVYRKLGVRSRTGLARFF